MSPSYDKIDDVPNANEVTDCVDIPYDHKLSLGCPSSQLADPLVLFRTSPSHSALFYPHQLVDH